MRSPAALATGAVTIDGVRDLEAFVTQLVELPGIGPWTAHYVAMRALHLPDAFPAADLGVKKALGGTPRTAEARAEAWRPFRSYAVMHLWTLEGSMLTMLTMTSPLGALRLFARTDALVGVYLPTQAAARAPPSDDARARAHRRRS